MGDRLIPDYKRRNFEGIPELYLFPVPACRVEEMPIVANQDPPAAESSGNNNAITDLDPQVWQKLPYELLEKVHLCLPLQSLARFRSVCTAWNKVVIDEGFIRVRSELVPQKPWVLITSTANSVCIFDTGFEKWLTFPIPFNAGNLHAVATAGGLLCFSNAWSQWPGMAVLNPATNRWRRLPPMRTWMITTVGMVYNDLTHTYKILVCGRREDDGMITEVYDSAIGQWAPGGLPSAARKYGGDTMAWLNGIFYCLTFPYTTLSLIAYDLVNADWHEVPVPMPIPIMSPSVVECNGKLLLVGGMDEPEFVIQIWELDFQRVEWVEVERMPSQICKDFESKMIPSKPFSCCCTGDMLFFTLPNNSAYMPALVFDVRKRIWIWWPTSGFPPHLPRVNAGRSCGMSFEPRLHARV